MSFRSLPFRAVGISMLVLVAVALILTVLDEAGQDAGPLDDVAMHKEDDRDPAPGRAILTSGREPPGTVEPGAPAPKPGQFSLRVLDEATRAPIVDLDVWDGVDKLLGRTDEEGVLRATRPGRRLSYGIETVGYLPTRGELTADKQSELLLVPGVPFSGVVRDARTGELVAGALVRAWDVDRARFVGSNKRSDAVGRFQFAALRPSHPFELVTRVEGCVPVRPRFQHDGSRHDLEVVVAEGGSIDGMLVDPKGKPMLQAGIPVFLVAANAVLPGDEATPQGPAIRRRLLKAQKARAAPASKARGDLEAWTTFETRTNELGRFSIAGVPIDRGIQVVARLDDSARLRSEPIHLEPTKRHVSVVLEAPARGSLVVVLKGTKDASVPRVSMMLSAARHSIPLPLKAKRKTGEYVYERIPVGGYVLVVNQRDGVELEESIKIESEGTTRVALSLHCTESASGHVRGADGEPVNEARLKWIPRNAGPQDRSVSVESRRNGSFVVQGAYGSADIAIAPPDNFLGASTYKPAKVVGVDTGEHSIEVRLERRPRLACQVFGPRPIGPCTVEIITSQYRGVHRVHPDSEGRFSIPAVPEPGGRAVLRTAGLAPTTFRFHPRGVPAELAFSRIFFDEEGTISVRVMAGGAPVQGARVSAVEPLRGTWRTNLAGELLLKGLPASPTEIEVESPSPYFPVVRVRVGRALPGVLQTIDLGRMQGRVRGRLPARYYRLRPHPYRRGYKSILLEPGADGWFETVAPVGSYRVVTIRGKLLGTLSVSAGQTTLVRGIGELRGK